MSDLAAVPPPVAAGADATAAPERPLSLDRARLLLSWLRAQRAVDQRLSELLAAGPGGERRVSGQIEQIGELMARAAGAFDAYRTSAAAGIGSDSPGAPPMITLVH